MRTPIHVVDTGPVRPLAWPSGAAGIVRAALLLFVLLSGTLACDRLEANQTETVPSGTTFVVSLQAPLSSSTNQDGDAVVATATEPVLVDGSTVIPAGATVRGVVRNVDANGTAAMTIDFTAIETGDGSAQPVSADPIKLVARPDAGENATKIVGGGVLGAVIGAIADGGEGAAIGGVLGTAAGTIAVIVDGDDVELPSGQKIAVRLAEPADLRVQS